MDEETLRKLLRSRQELEALQLLQRQPQTRRNSHGILQQLNQGLGGSTAIHSHARAPAEAPAPAATGLNQLLASRRRSSLLAGPTQASAFAPSLHTTTSSTLGSAQFDLSSLAISQEIKRLQLQQQLAATNASASNPFLYSSQVGLPSSTAAATDPHSTLLHQYLSQKARLPCLSPTTGALGSTLTSNPSLSAAMNEAPNQSILEAQLLREARLLIRPAQNPPTTFAAAAVAKAPAPFPRVPSTPSYGEGSRKMRGGVIEPFPEKLHRLLLEVELTGRTDIISFVSEGRAFAIHNSEAFFRDVVPLYFKQSRLSSFKRQLNLYGFELINSGPSRGAYYHELFQKDNPELCRRMRRVAVKVSAAKPSKTTGVDADKEGSDGDSDNISTSMPKDEVDEKVASMSGPQKANEA